MPFLLFLFLFLISCSDDVLYNEVAPRIFVEVLNRSDTILVGDTVLFWAVMSLPPEDAEFFWAIEKENSPSSPAFYQDLIFERSFNESGLYNVKFQARDRFSDTYAESFFIRVSSAPICNGLSVKFFQGSPTFEWDCADTDGGSLTYRFLLLTKYDRYEILRTDTTLTKNTLQLGYILQKNDAIHIIATNRYGFEARLDSLWRLP